MDFRKYTVKYRDKDVHFCGFDLDHEDGSDGCVGLHLNDDEEHQDVTTQVQVFFNGQPYWHSADVWFPGMVHIYG